MPTNYRLAIDIGGTFTDVAIADPNGQISATTKVATTPHDPTDGALAGTRRVLRDHGLRISALSAAVHGTTLATNALIERRGAHVACVTTEGFRDILEIAYERRYAQYDIDIEKPDLIVPRSRCFTVPERMNVHGDVLRPLDEAAVDALVDNLDACGAEAIAVCLLHAYANPAHEHRLAELISARRPNIFVSLSSEVSPEAREFDRLCTTIANAYIQPLMSTYLARFAEAFAREGLTCPVLMMTSGGGMTTIDTARRLPIRLVESGPCGGAVLAASVARQSGLDAVLSFDMGGTTAKLCLIDDAVPQTARTFEIARAARFIKGSGMPVRIPVVDMIEIGAGGGSLAAVDPLGRLTVGPKSAGADPGPAAFGRGGTAPTVTDADVALGYIDPTRFAEGRIAIDVDKARAALSTTVGGPLALAADAAAHGVSQIVDESMASAGRMHAVECGRDLGARTMIAFGGNGPLHATRVARGAGVKRIIIPPDPGVGSAVGFLEAPVSFEVVRSRYTRLETMDVAAINAMLADMVEEGRRVVLSGAPDAALATDRTAYVRYHGQGHEIAVPLADRALTSGDLDVIRQRFETAYAAQFSRPVPGMRIEILNWAVGVASPRPERPPTHGTSPTSAEHNQDQATVASTRRIICDLTGVATNAQVIDRAQVTTREKIDGPALVVEPQTTTLVSRDFSAIADGFGNLVLTRKEAGL